MMTFDNEEELEKVAETHKKAEFVELQIACHTVKNQVTGDFYRMVIRIADHDPTAQNVLSAKFGCEPTHVAPRLLQKAHDLGVRVIGVS